MPLSTTSHDRGAAPSPHGRTLAAAAVVGLCCLAVAAQLARLALIGQEITRVSAIHPVHTNFARPDIIDRHGRLIATDVVVPSLFADPSLVLDRDEAVEKLIGVFPDLDKGVLSRTLSDRDRRFTWIKRGLPPSLAQQAHDLGLPELDFRNELRRAYPAGTLAGHAIGMVDADNKGIAGLERFIDENTGIDSVHGTNLTGRPPLQLSLDIGVQHALEDELGRAMERYQSRGAAGVVLDADTGEIAAAASLPSRDPARAMPSLANADKVAGGVFELGSVFKLFTVAMALEGGTSVNSVFDVRRPLVAGRHAIEDFHPSERPLSVAEILLRSSNKGAAMLAQAAGASRQRKFLDHLGLTGPISTEAGPVAHPLLPGAWGPAETITIAYGHGLAVAPLQVAGATAALVNGGRRVKPTFAHQRQVKEPGEQVMSPATSARVRELMRRNVASPEGTGRRAEAVGYRVGGKTGTAEIAAEGRYRESAVIASFLGAFPMDAPRFVILVVLFEPKPTGAAEGRITAGFNAAPATARIVERIAPLLGVAPGPDPGT